MQGRWPVTCTAKVTVTWHCGKAKQASDWVSNGHAEQVLWVFTDGTTPYTTEVKWVEAGVTHGWRGADQHVYYTAHAHINANGQLVVYQDFNMGSAAAGQTRTYTINRSGTSYGVQIGNNNTIWNGHSPDTLWVEAGIESTCHTSRVDNYRIQDMQMRRKNSQAWYAVNNGALAEDQPVVVAWCNKPRSARTALNSVIPLQC